MGFSTNNFINIKEVVEQAEKYTVCKCTNTKKNKVTNEFDPQFSGYVKFIGNAHLQRPMAGQRIKVTSCDVVTCYKKDGELCFYKNPQYLVFGYELQDGDFINNNSKNTQELYAMANNDNEIPF